MYTVTNFRFRRLKVKKRIDNGHAVWYDKIGNKQKRERGGLKMSSLRIKEEYEDRADRMYHLVDFELSDIEYNKLYEVAWRGSPTRLGEIFNRKVKEYTSLDVLLSYFEFNYFTGLEFKLQIRSDEYGSAETEYAIATYKEDNLSKDSLCRKDVLGDVLRAFFESIDELGLPPACFADESLTRSGFDNPVSVIITNVDQRITRDEARSEKESKV